MVKIIAFVIIMLIWYLACSLVAMSFSIIEWHWLLRLIFAALGAFTLFRIIIIDIK
jgi:hypothetical protein